MPKSDREIFDAAVEINTAAGRAAFLDRECAGDREQRDRVQALMDAFENAGEFMEDRDLGPGTARPEQWTATRIVERPKEGPGSVIGNYKLLQEIGEGGFGVVYMAEQFRPVKRKVALKIIKPGMDTREVVARFEAERQALALMLHPNIAQVLDAGSTDTGKPFFVMELVRGIPITEFCDQNKLSTTLRLELFLDICAAIQHAHQKGVIHRDIKPSNVLVTLHDGQPVPKVIDFGIAKALNQELTEKTLFTAYGQMIGTPLYTSPEQAEMSGLDIDTRSDIYSLGVLLYELLTGETPISRKELKDAGYQQMLKLIREKEPTKPSMLVSILCRTSTTLAESHRTEPAALINQIKGDLDWIALKALEKDRNRRYESASDFAQDIRRHLRNEAVLARPPSAAYFLQKMVQRNRLAFTAAAAVMISIVVGLAVSMSLYFQERTARTRAVLAEKEQSRLRQEAQHQEQVAVESALQAETASAKTMAALKLVEMALIQELVEKGQADVALARLARHLREEKTDYAAADRVMFLLQHHGTRSPVRPPIRLTNEASSWQLSPDGLKLVTTTAETAQLWDAQTGQPVGDPLRHTAKISSAQFNADATKLVTASRLGDSTARIWDVLTGQPVGKPMRHQNIIHGAKFSPDGSLIVTCAWDYRARVWDAWSGEQVGRDMVHQQDVTTAEFSPDSTRVITGSRDKSARIWNARTGQPVGNPLLQSNTVFRARFSPNGKWVVLGAGTGYARVWDAHTCQPVSDEMRHGGILTTVAFSPDGQRVLTASREAQSARLWDARTGEAIGEPMQHQSAVNSAEFSPDGLRVLTASAGGAARLWDGHTGGLLAEPITHEGRVQGWQSGGLIGAQFSPDGTTIFTFTGSEAYSWDGRSTAPVLRPFRNSGTGKGAQFSAEGSKVIVSMDRQTARLFDVRSGRVIGVPLDVGAALIHAEFSPTGQRVATMANHPDSGAVVRLWDARSGEPVGEPVRVSGGGALHFSPDGKLLCVRILSQLLVLDTGTGRPNGVHLQGESRLVSLEFSPDSRHVIGCSGAKARVWNVSGGEVVGDLLHEGAVKDAQFSPDGLWIATACDDKTARLWNADSRQPLDLVFRHQAAINKVQFSADGRWLATASKDGTARLWVAQTGEPIGEPLRHQGSVTAVQFSHDGKRVATASEDSTVRVWDALTGQPLTESLRHIGSILRVQFGPDDLTVLTVGAVGDLSVWDVPRSGKSGPIPDWLPALAEAVAGQRLKEDGVTETVPVENLIRLRERLLGLPQDTPAARWARWYCADRAARTVSPSSATTVNEYVRQCLEENTVASLGEAVRLAPTNGLAFARLAKAMMGGSGEQNPRLPGEAAFYSRHAMKLSPNDPEVQKLRVQVEEAIAALPSQSSKP